jgi:hypothetical protein
LERTQERCRRPRPLLLYSGDPPAPAERRCPSSTRAATSANPRRLSRLVQGSDASNATKLLARSPGSRASSKRRDYCSPAGGGVDLVAGAAAEFEESEHSDQAEPDCWIHAEAELSGARDPTQQASPCRWIQQHRAGPLLMFGSEHLPREGCPPRGDRKAAGRRRQDGVGSCLRLRREGSWYSCRTRGTT